MSYQPAPQTASDLRGSSPPPARRYPTGAANAPRTGPKVAMGDLDEPMPF
jgi:hypothetical protein